MRPLGIQTGQILQFPPGEVIEGALCAARLTASSQSIAAGGFVAVTFSSAPIESHDQFNGASPLNLVITVPGVYLLGYGLIWAAVAPLAQARISRVGDATYGQNEAENSAAITGSDMLTLATNDIIRLQAAHGAASTRTLISATLWAARLG